ncbi:MAG: single-stranded-DNA-specific exonuclease RecJ [Deltaproteobacteria bacterium RIFOXYA12_FULL_58_15]|nr:MAG: single-stranded-DNA-specific exonuclease RecJ [Deltaproteobacteria bacterium RIFOXYA12_FULL_58_15]OGR13631.1 MAG: single-stranded-DNA-specific exonuclease RecJ [Deltaproteobacteria bacterium RIFOXYB12_FULL_58_9]
MSHDESDHNLSFTGKRWVWPQYTADNTQGSWVDTILQHRGIVDPADVEQYLSPSLKTLDDPMQLPDIDVAVGRIMAALQNKEPITVYGDYDADGVTSTCVLVDFLRQVGGDVDYYIPDRRTEGYGLNTEAVREIATRARLLITVDCGITAADEIAVAKDLGVDTIVVDHHRVPEQLPNAVANINPHRDDSRYPTKELCAAGVAFLLAAAVRRGLRDVGAFASKPEPDLRDLLDLVALATVADMVPLRGANRVLVAAGLRRMAQTKRVGMRALLDVSRVNPALVTATDLGFRLGPRINARGRIAHAGEAVELFLTRDPKRARMLASSLDAANHERREIEHSTVLQAVAKVEALGLADHCGLVVHDPSWHPGVVGLVATRLVSRFNRPTIVIGEGGKGSGRTFEGLDLFEAIKGAAGHLIRFGGHAAAAGITIDTKDIDAFRAAFSEAVRAQIGELPFVASLEPELEVAANRLNIQMLNELKQLEPFGQENPEPLLVARDISVSAKRVVGQGHLKLRLGDEQHEAIAFGLGNLAPELPEKVDVAFRLTTNDYGGQTSLQLKVEDLRPASRRQP